VLASNGKKHGGALVMGRSKMRFASRKFKFGERFGRKDNSAASSEKAAESTCGTELHAKEVRMVKFRHTFATKTTGACEIDMGGWVRFFF
jgi:hypothetical protein